MTALPPGERPAREDQATREHGPECCGPGGALDGLIRYLTLRPRPAGRVTE